MATLADYTASSNRRIQTKDAALTVAIEMLEKISTGRTYDSLEFLSLVARMKEIQAQAQAPAAYESRDASGNVVVSSRPMAGQPGYRASRALALVMHIREHQYQTEARMVTSTPSAAIDTIIALTHAIDLSCAELRKNDVYREMMDPWAIITRAAEEVL